VTERIGLYPGTFDPVTLGHADIIRRGAKLVDRLIVGVTTNPAKDPMFAPDERIEMVRAEVASVMIPIESVLALKEGDLLRLNSPAAAGITLYADQVPVHTGRPGRSGSRRAVQVTGNLAKGKRP